MERDGKTGRRQTVLALILTALVTLGTGGWPVRAAEPAKEPPAQHPQDTGGEKRKDPREERGQALQQEGFKLYGEGRFREGVPKLRELLKFQEALFGPESAQVGFCLSNLGEFLRLTADYPGA